MSPSGSAHVFGQEMPHRFKTNPCHRGENTLEHRYILIYGIFFRLRDKNFENDSQLFILRAFVKTPEQTVKKLIR